MFEAPKSPYLVPFDGNFHVSEASTKPQTKAHRHVRKHRKEATRNLNKLQRVLAAGDRHAVLLVFQAMDAAGKDSTIRAVMQGVDPSGCQVFSFKKPSSLCVVVYRGDDPISFIPISEQLMENRDSLDHCQQLREIPPHADGIVGKLIS